MGYFGSWGLSADMGRSGLECSGGGHGVPSCESFFQANL